MSVTETKSNFCGVHHIDISINYRTAMALVELVKSTCDVGIFIDFNLLMRTHVQCCFAVLNQLLQICRLVPTDMFNMLVSSLVLKCLDYGNSVLASLPV